MAQETDLYLSAPGAPVEPDDALHEECAVFGIFLSLIHI